MNSIFTDTQGLRPRRRAYNMSYRNDYTCALGELVPVYWQNLIPNSSIRIRTHALIRLTPMIAPIMDNLDYYIHFWQSPERTLKGEQFTDFITGKLPMEEFENKYFNTTVLACKLYDLIEDAGFKDTMPIYDRLIGDSSLMDMLGYDKLLFNIDELTGRQIQCNKLIMYVQLLVHWYINENVLPWESFLEDSEWATDTDIQGDISEPIAIWLFNLYNNFGNNRFMTHAWPKDYFTSALPTLQFGGPTYLPIGDTAPVTFPDGIQIHASEGGAIQAVPATQVQEPYLSYPLRVSGNGTTGVANLQSVDPGTSGSVNQIITIAGESVTNDQGSDTVAVADLSEATAITINEFRITNALQVFKEREMRYGRRAPEYYKGFYGVTPGDLRLQLPKFIGGGRLAINIADIEQTSQSTENSPQGNLAGKGTALGGAFATASTFAPEETLILGLAWAMPKVTYSQMLSRHDTKINDRFLYFNPSFVHIGEQEVWNYELYAGVIEDDDKEFGYQPRYTEYRFHANECHGDFKSSLSFWTLSRIFDSEPALNAEFIYMQPEALSRIFAVQTDTHGHVVNNMLCSLKFQVSLIQPLSRYGTPSLLV